MAVNLRITTIVLMAVLTFGAAHARDTTVGGASMRASRTIVENMQNSKDHTTLVTAVKSAALIDTLSGPGPFTVFAPTNEAFARLPKGAVDNLLRPENKPQLTTVLTYHIVPGSFTTSDLFDKINEGHGKAELKTIEGESLTVQRQGTAIELLDAKGNISRVTIPNVMQSNGVVHVVNTVLLP